MPAPGRIVLRAVAAVLLVEHRRPGRLSVSTHPLVLAQGWCSMPDGGLTLLPP